MIIAVDFDGTLVRQEFPNIGPEAPNAFRVLRRLQADGHKLILYTMRSDCLKRNYLQEAVDYCRERGIEFWGVNRNPDQISWTTSPKVYAQVYIDDLAIGVPIKDGVVDWDAVEDLLVYHQMGLGDAKFIIHDKPEDTCL